MFPQLRTKFTTIPTQTNNTKIVADTLTALEEKLDTHFQIFYRDI